MTPPLTQQFEDTRRFLLHYSSLHVQSLSRQLGYAMDGAFHERQSLRDELQARLPSLTLDDVNRCSNPLASFQWHSRGNTC